MKMLKHKNKIYKETKAMNQKIDDMKRKQESERGNVE